MTLQPLPWAGSNRRVDSAAGTRNLRHAPRKVDEKIKYRLFERSGVGEYWIVDPELDVAKVCRRATDGSLPRVAELSAEMAETLTTPILPGLAVPLHDLFA